jgi:hypothetical protein
MDDELNSDTTGRDITVDYVSESDNADSDTGSV